MPLAREALDDAGHTLRDLDAVVVGIGPGPFTGLRVGIATAAALGDALDIPVHGVPSHDGLARSLRPLPGDLLVVTDARRREVYLSAYRGDGHRAVGPLVLAPAAVPAGCSPSTACPRRTSPGPGRRCSIRTDATVLARPAGRAGDRSGGVRRHAAADRRGAGSAGPAVPAPAGRDRTWCP